MNQCLYSKIPGPLCKDPGMVYVKHVVGLFLPFWGTATLAAPVFLLPRINVFFSNMEANICCHFFPLLILAILTGIKCIAFAFLWYIRILKWDLKTSLSHLCFTFLKTLGLVLWFNKRKSFWLFDFLMFIYLFCYWVFLYSLDTNPLSDRQLVKIFFPTL